MPQLTNGGHQPPPERTLDDMLDDDVRDAIDQVEAVDLGEAPKPDNGWKVGIISGLIVGAFFFGLSIWWDSTAAIAAGPMKTPEVNIGVDPNTEVKENVE